VRHSGDRTSARPGPQILVGLAGATYCGWLFVKYLWVSDTLRRQGVGRELMGQAEGRARERGCHSTWLDTFSFQARGFYEKLGYEEFGRLDYPTRPLPAFHAEATDPAEIAQVVRRCRRRAPSYWESGCRFLPSGMTDR